MKTIQLTPILLSSLLMIGCGSTGGIKKDSQKYVENVRVTESTVAENTKCLTKQSSFKKITWKKLIKSANACVKNKKWSAVRNIANHLAQTEPNSPWGAYYLSLESENSEQYPRALWMIEAALKKVPSQPILLYQKGRLLWKLGNYESGVETMEEALKLNPSMNSARLFLAKVELRDQQYSKAYDLFKVVAEQSPNLAEAHAGLAECLTQKQDWNEAISSWDNAISLSPRRLDYRLRRIRILDEKQGNASLSLEEYRKIRLLKQKNRLKGQLPAYIQARIDQLEAKVASEAAKKVSQRQPAQKKKVSK